MFTCKTCKRSFSSKRGLSNHKRSHFKNPTNTASNLGPAGTPVNGIIGEIKSQKDGNGELRTDKLTSGNQSEDELPPFISTEKKNPTESNRMFVGEIRKDTTSLIIVQLNSEFRATKIFYQFWKFFKTIFNSY